MRKMLPDQCWQSIRCQGFSAWQVQKLSEHILAVEGESGERFEIPGVKLRISKQLGTVVFDGFQFLSRCKRHAMSIKELNSFRSLFRTQEPDLPVPVKDASMKGKISTLSENLL